MLSMQAKNQLLFTLISQNGGYHLRSKKEKAKLLDKYCQITGQNRKAVIRKIRSGQYVKSMRKEKGEEKRQRTKTYGHDVTAVLIRLWEIFDRPCGQRLQPLLTTEVERLKKLGEIDVSGDMLRKLKTISARTIDATLAPHKEKERLNKKTIMSLIRSCIRRSRSNSPMNRAGRLATRYRLTSWNIAACLRKDDS